MLRSVYINARDWICHSYKRFKELRLLRLFFFWGLPDEHLCIIAPKNTAPPSNSKPRPLSTLWSLNHGDPIHFYRFISALSVFLSPHLPSAALFVTCDIYHPFQREFKECQILRTSFVG